MFWLLFLYIRCFDSFSLSFFPLFFPSLSPFPSPDQKSRLYHIISIAFLYASTFNFNNLHSLYYYSTFYLILSTFYKILIVSVINISSFYHFSYFILLIHILCVPRKEISFEFFFSLFQQHTCRFFIKGILRTRLD